MSTVHVQENVRCGDDWLFSGPLTDNNGNPLTLTSATFLYNLDSLDLSENIYTTSSVTVVSESAATVEYGIPAATTATIAPGTYYDTLRVTLSGGGTFTMVEGIINVMPLPTA